MMSELHGNKKKLKVQCQKFHPSKSIMLDLKSDCINAHRGNFSVGLRVCTILMN